MRAWEKIRSFSPEQIRQGIELTGWDVSSKLPSPILSMLYGRWAELDPEGALRSARAVEGKAAIEIACDVISLWSKQDPDAVIRWIKEDPAYAAARGAESLLASSLMHLPAEQLLEKCGELGQEGRNAALDALSFSMNHDPASRAEFLSWVETLEGSERERLMASFPGQWSFGDPADFMEGSEALPLPQERKRQLQQRNLFVWLAQDPAPALEWMMAHPEAGDLRTRAIAYGKWSREDPEAAARWYDKQEDRPAFAAELVKSLGLAALTDVYGPRPDDELRQRSMRDHFRIWSEAEPEEAAAWLGSSPMEIQRTLQGTADE